MRITAEQIYHQLFPHADNKIFQAYKVLEIQAWLDSGAITGSVKEIAQAFDDYQERVEA